MAVAYAEGTDLDDFILAYEAAQACAGQADLAAFLPDPGHALYRDVLCELVRVDLEFAWTRGQPRQAETYLQRFPELFDHPDDMLAIVTEEYRLRRQAGAAPPVEEYFERFPELEDSLRLQLETYGTRRSGPKRCDLSVAPDSGVAWQGAGTLPVIEGYDVVGELGRGAMGVVYKARDRRLNRLVAIKMILAGAHAAPRELSRFETEACAVARLQHPHIVQIHAIGEQEGRPFVCLELVAGGSLAQKLGGKPLLPLQGAELTETLARAVHYAHEQQIVHRDLKPANVLLAESDAQRGIALGDREPSAFFEPKITDFGLAKLLDHEQDDSAEPATPLTAGPVGTPPYMAPEQAGNAYGTSVGSGRAIDVYALGAMLYESLTGRPPFVAATVYETLQQVISLEPVSPRRLQPQVPRDLETICLACLRKEPHKRYASALALADDLRRFLDGKPIKQRRPAVWEPALKWALRRPAAAAWIALGVTVFLALLVSSLYYLEHREEWARQSSFARYQRFVQMRDEACFQNTLLSAVRVSPRDEAIVDQSATREAARKALAFADMSPQGRSSLGSDVHLSPAEQTDVTESCHELLLILAGPRATAAPEPAVDALRVLDHAGEPGRASRAFHIRRAQLLDWQGDSAGAEEERNLARTIEPASASDHYFIGVEQYQGGDAAGAVRSFREALRRQPRHFEARCFLAVCSLNAGRPDDAAIDLTACIGQRPDFAWPYVLRGFASLQRRAVEDAEADFAAALDLDSRPEIRYAVHANRGLLWLQQGRLTEAVTDLEQAIALRPDECQGHIALAQALGRQQKWNDAVHEIDVALRLRPDLPAVHRARGQLYVAMKEPDAALRDFETAIHLDPKAQPETLAGDLVECGKIHHHQRRYCKALAAYDHALHTAPSEALTHHLRGESLLELNRGQEAEEAFGKCVELKPLFGPAFRGRGQARVRLGKFAEAVEDYTQALRLERDASILAHRGWAYFFTDSWKLAEHDFEESIQLAKQPDDASIGCALARIMLGDHRRAVADIEALLRRYEPQTPEMMHNVACVFALAAGRVKTDAAPGERDELERSHCRQALAALRKAVRLVPADQRLAFWREKMRPDAALDSIRKSDEFQQFDKQLEQQSNRKNADAR